MFLSNSIFTIDSHAAGEPMRIIVDGYPRLQGKTMQEKMAYMKENLDWLKTCTLQEPRGHKDMVGGILTPACIDGADIGIFFYDILNYAPMCGHGIIAVSTIMVEIGMVIVKEPVTTIVFDTPAGLVKSYVSVENSVVTSVAFESVPAFLYKRNLEITVPEIGDLVIDIGYGGNFYAIADVEPLGFDINFYSAKHLAEIGMNIIKATNEAIRVEHPMDKSINYLDAMLWNQDKVTPNGAYKVISVYGDAHPDRSPCGTGTATRSARLFAQGKLKIGEEFTHESFIGTQFKSKILREEKVGNFDGVIPLISGNAYITGFNQIMIDQRDPIKYGIII